MWPVRTVFNPSDSGGTVGGHTGNPPLQGDPTTTHPMDPSPQLEVGQAQDIFAVYRGNRSDPLDSPPVWRYMETDALRSPSVPAVDAFKKIILETEKQQAAKP